MPRLVVYLGVGKRQSQANLYRFGVKGLLDRDAFCAAVLSTIIKTTRVAPTATTTIPINITTTSGFVFASLTTSCFTPEMCDSYIKLIYLRSRYYAPDTGRFLTKDSWQGDYNRPLSLNSWNYVEGNPINLIDPSGMIPEGKGDEADELVEKLRKYNIHIEKDWGYQPVAIHLPGNWPGDLQIGCEWAEGNWRTVRELRLVKQAVTRIANKMGDAKFKSAMGHVKIIRWGSYKETRGMALPGLISLPNFMFRADDNRTTYDIIHEFGHIWDYRSNLTLSSEMSTFIGTRVCNTTQNMIVCYFDINAGREDAPGYKKDLYAGRNQLEDWAEAFASTIYPSFYRSLDGYREIGSLRKQFVEDKINGIR